MAEGRDAAGSGAAAGGLDADGPRVVALGGGHGLAATLRAARTYASSITAVVSVADDGRSSGRLRRDYPVLPPGDIRKCLVALAGEESLWTRAFEHRFVGGELDDHALGNLLLAGLEQVTGDAGEAIEVAAGLLDTVGTVIPATREAVTLTAEVDGTRVIGQVVIMQSAGRIQRLSLRPARPEAASAALDAIAAADQILLAPGSLYTSLLPVVCVPDIAAALEAASGCVVQIANLEPEIPETTGLCGADHVQAVLAHGGRVDEYLFDPAAGLPVTVDAIAALGVKPRAATVAAPDAARTHDPDRLAGALRDRR